MRHFLSHPTWGAYTQDVTFSPAITPSHMLAIDREMFSGSVGAGFIVALPFHHGDLEPDCVGGVDISVKIEND